MLYLLDANVLIDANRDYYPMERVPEFWEWIDDCGENGKVKIPIEIYEEIKHGKDNLSNWAKNSIIKNALLLDEEVNVSLVSRITDEGYASNLTDDEVEKIGRDPFLIAYAYSSPNERFIVTTEVSKPKKIRANRHLPDVCKDFGIRSYNTFEFARIMNFSTSWKS